MQTVYRLLSGVSRRGRIPSLQNIAAGVLSIGLICSTVNAQKVYPEPDVETASAEIPAPTEQECSTVDAVESDIRTRLAETSLEIVSKKRGEPPRCAKVTLPHLGKAAIVRDRVAYVSMTPSGLAIVDLNDPTKPRYDRTVAISVGSMRDLDGTLWILNSLGTVVKLELRNLRPTGAHSTSAETTSSARFSGRTVTLRDGSKLFGQMVKLAADQTITLRLENGETRTIPITEVTHIDEASSIPVSELGGSSMRKAALRNQSVSQLDDTERAPTVQLPKFSGPTQGNSSATSTMIICGSVAIPGLALLIGGIALWQSSESDLMKSGSNTSAPPSTTVRSDYPLGASSSTNLSSLGSGAGIVMMVAGGLLSVGGGACVVIGGASQSSRSSQPLGLRKRPSLRPTANGIAAELRF